MVLFPEGWYDTNIVGAYDSRMRKAAGIKRTITFQIMDDDFFGSYLTQHFTLTHPIAEYRDKGHDYLRKMYCAIGRYFDPKNIPDVEDLRSVPVSILLKTHHPIPPWQPSEHSQPVDFKRSPRFGRALAKPTTYSLIRYFDQRLGVEIVEVFEPFEDEAARSVKILRAHRLFDLAIGDGKNVRPEL